MKRTFQPSNLELCDYNTPGDESEPFDLSIQTTTVLGFQSPILYTVPPGDDVARDAS